MHAFICHYIFTHIQIDMLNTSSTNLNQHFILRTTGKKTFLSTERQYFSNYKSDKEQLSMECLIVIICMYCIGYWNINTFNFLLKFL